MGKKAIKSPDQTPCLFLNGGAAAMFSGECVKLLNKAGYDKNDFGSYNHVAKQIRNAKQAVKKYADDTAAGNPGTPPSDHQQFLAGPYDPNNPNNPFPNACQSGHLTQNAVYQTTRGDPCSNVPGAPGHSDAQFPCMPQKGSATQKGGEHEQVSRAEENDAGANGPPGSPYPAGQIAADSDARANNVANNQALAQANGRNPVQPGQGGGEGGSAGGGAGSGGDAGGATGPNPNAVTRPNAPYNQPINGSTAGECINAFRKAGEAAMKDKCADERTKNAAKANGGPGKTDAEGQAYRQALADKAAAAQAAADANPNDPAAQQAASRAAAAATGAERANCMAQQGQQIANGNPGSGDGTVPQNATPPAESGESGGATTTEP